MMAVELPREEVALLLGTLTACGFLILGVLELMWPSASRRGHAPSSRSSSPRPASVVTRSARAPMAVRSAPAATPLAPSAPSTRRPAPMAAGSARMAPQPASVAAPPSPLEIARVLLERANTEKDLERRVTILNRAVAGLTRSVQTAPDDDALSELLTSTRAQLWQTWERIALARLAAAMPWNGEILAAETTTVLTRTR
jgi:hypothetical protein